ncbi:hypothetical protein ABH977_006521 [Bradyrhizobium ottawaense]
MTRSFPASNAPTNALSTLPTPLPTILPTPLPTGTNGTANACSPTPHTPRALEAPNAAGARLGVPAAQGREGRKAAAYPHVCDNAEVGADRRCIMHLPGRQDNRLLSCSRSGPALPMRFPVPRDASRLCGNALIALLNSAGHPICPNHVAPFKGFSRALSHELQHSWKQTRAQGSRPMVCQIPMVCHEKTGGRGWWGRNGRACLIFMCPKSFARICRKIGGALSENLVGHC